MPTLTAVAQPTQARVQLRLDWAGITYATIERLDPDGQWRPVRNAEPIVCNPSACVYDHEAPLDVAVSYRATSPDGSGAVNANPYFEVDTSDWSTLSSTIASVTTFAREATHSMRLTPAGAVASVGAQTVVQYSAVVGTTYAFDVWVYSPAGWSDVRPCIDWFTGAGVFISSSIGSAIAIPAGQWTHLVGSYTAPATTGKMVGRVRMGATPAATDLLYVDKAFLESPVPLTVSSGAVTLASSGHPWLTHPGLPAYGSMAVINDLPATVYPARNGKFTPIGRADPVVVYDVRGSGSASVLVQTTSQADITRMRAMLAGGAPLLLRLPATWGGDSRYISVGDVNEARPISIGTDLLRRWSLPYDVLGRPGGLSAGAVGVTCADVAAKYATCAALAAAGRTCISLATSV